MKRVALFITLLLFVVFTTYGLLKAPQKVGQVELVVEGGKGKWKEKISERVLSLIIPDQTVDPETIKEWESIIKELPWVRECKVSASGSKITVKVKEEVPSFSICYKNRCFLLGENGFVLDELKSKPNSIPVYYYKGKTPPFRLENGFLKLKNLVKIELELLRGRLVESGYSEHPEIILTDEGTMLVFRKKKMVVFLGIDSNAWRNFKHYSELVKKPHPGLYDFRYNDALIVGRKL